MMLSPTSKQRPASKYTVKTTTSPFRGFGTVSFFGGAHARVRSEKYFFSSQEQVRSPSVSMLDQRYVVSGYQDFIR